MGTRGSACRGPEGCREPQSWPQTPKTKFSAQRFICPEGERTGNQRQRQEMEGEGEGEGNKGRGKVFVLGDKGLSFDRETDVAQ